MHSTPLRLRAQGLELRGEAGLALAFLLHNCGRGTLDERTVGELGVALVKFILHRPDLAFQALSFRIVIDRHIEHQTQAFEYPHWRCTVLGKRGSHADCAQPRQRAQRFALGKGLISTLSGEEQRNPLTRRQSHIGA